MQALLEVIMLALLILVPGAGIFFGMRQKKRAETAEEKLREGKLREMAFEVEKKINGLDRNGVADLANSMYPEPSTKRLDDN